MDVVKQAGQKGVAKWLDDAKIRFHKATIERRVARRIQQLRALSLLRVAIVACRMCADEALRPASGSKSLGRLARTTHPLDRDEPAAFTASFPRTNFSNRKIGRGTGASVDQIPSPVSQLF